MAALLVLFIGYYGHDRMVVGFVTTYVISTHHVVSSNPTQARCTWYNIMW